MKTKILGGIAIVAIAVTLNVSLNTSKTNNASSLALANVEALAQGEVNPNVCYNCKMVDYKNNQGVIYKSCCESGYQQGSECNYKAQVNC